jgi:diguanylate cyclase (GGDEF)-like protein
MLWPTYRPAGGVPNAGRDFVVRAAYMKILLAEDDLVTRRFLTVMLQNLGHEVTATADGEEALAQFLSYHPPVVISDWHMPHLDGVELCQRLRNLGLDQYTFFILLSVKSDRSDYLKAMQAGVDDFLDKSISLEELSVRLRVADRIIVQREDSDRKIRTLARFPSDNPNPVLQVDTGGKLVYANMASLPLLNQWNCNVGEPAPEKLRGLADQISDGEERRELEIDCADRTFSFSATSVAEAGIVYLYGHDITDRKRAENELVQLKNQAEEYALHDQLTGLPNRRLLADRLKQEISRAGRLSQKLGLLVIDIDNFKQINDGYGHKVGDQVIVSIGRHLKDSLRDSDTVCRWGGDELVILLSNLQDRTDISAVCRKVMDAVKTGVAADGISAPVSLSIGSAVFPDDAEDPTLLMQQADHALYVAKDDGRNCWRPFSGFPTGHDAKGKANIFIRLNSAVAEGKITVFYQPVVNAGSRLVVGAEALARWKDDELGWVSPDVFIPLAEERGLIFPLGHLVLTQSLDQLAEWRRMGHEMSVSVNLSRRQVLDAGFREELLALVRQRDLKPEWVILEITERQSVIDQGLGRERLKELAAAGFQLSIDDFGSGYSSFDLVGEASFSELKINLALVRRSRHPRGRQVVEAIIAMGRTLGLRVVAEGVEDPLTQATLTAMGADKLQGYVFSKPVQAEGFLSFVEGYNARPEKRRRAA